MDSIEVITSWKGEGNFVAHVTGHDIPMSTNHDFGSSPKQLLLAGLAGCTGIDVVDMLKKMRVTFDEFSLTVTANQTTEHPKVYDYIKIVYQFKGADLDKLKIEKAVKLSKEKYCGVSAMLVKAAKIEFQILLN
jgi:putative redox protein